MVFRLFPGRPTVLILHHMQLRPCLLPYLAVALATASPLHASPQEAERIRRTHALAMDKWALEMRIASTQEEKQKIWLTRPDATSHVREMWVNISSRLDEDWTLDYAGWFLKIAPNLLVKDENGTPQPQFARQVEAIRAAVEKYHVTSAKIGPVCEAMALVPDPRSVGTLELIANKNPDPKIQGLAAYGAANQLKSLGEDPSVMRRRLNHLRKAIIQSADMKVGETTVAALAEDELHIILHLSKGRVAPDLVGTDSAGRATSLEASKGKVIALIFWNSNVPQADRVVQMFNELAAKYRGQAFEVIGVNNDTLEKLRSLQADGTVPWKNFSDPENKLAHEYRVGTWPLVYVLDKERKINYIGAPGSFVDLTVAALMESKPAN